jgi:hypothetical protein
MPVALRPYLQRPLHIVPLLPFAAKALAHLPGYFRRLRHAARRGGPRGFLGALPPPGLRGFLRLDRAMWRGFFCWIRRRPPPPRPAGLPLTYLERGMYPTVVAIVLVATCVEAPINAAIVSLFVKGAGARTTIHLLFGIAVAYSLVWTLADRWMLRGGHHVLTGTDLDLRVGARASGRVPLAAIEQCEVLREPRAAWAGRHGVRLADTLTVSPCDRPNVVLRLRPGAQVAIAHCQVERRPSCIFLYLDRPEALIASLAESRRCRA